MCISLICLFVHFCQMQVKILEKGLDVHHTLASAEIRPLHQLMEDMFIKMVDSVRNMVLSIVDYHFSFTC